MVIFIIFAKTLKIYQKQNKIRDVDFMWILKTKINLYLSNI